MDANPPSYTSISPCANHPFPEALGRTLALPLDLGTSRKHLISFGNRKTEGAETVPPPSVCVVSAAQAPSVLHDENAVETLLGGTDGVGLRSRAASCRYGTWDINPDWI
jgi:hypothetical protein